MSSKQQEDLKLTLSMQEFDLSTQRILIRLDVTNTGDQAVVLPRLQEGFIEEYGVWGGWFLNVFEKGSGQLRFNLKEHRLLREEDLIELKPGEHFLVTNNLAHIHYHHYDKHGERFFKKLIDIEGRYEAQFWLGLSSYVGRMESIAADCRDMVWEGDATSNTLTFFIVHEPRRMFFPDGQSPLVSPDGKYDIINTDNEQGSSDKRYVLYLRDTTTGERHAIYAYKNDVEILWSPEGGKLLINDSYTIPLIFLVEQKKLINIKEQFRHIAGEHNNILMYEHVNMIGTEWIDESSLKIKISARKDAGSRELTNWYEYDIVTGDLTRPE